MDNDSAVQQALDAVVFYKMNGEKGEGVELSKTFGVDGYPTFILLSGAGDELTRWMGYDEPNGWIEELHAAQADLTPLKDKEAQFAAHPDAKTALKLGELVGQAARHADAIAYFRQAAQLDPTGAGHALSAAAGVALQGLARQKLPADQAGAVLQEALAVPQLEQSDLLSIGESFMRLSAERDAALVTRYLPPILERTAALDSAPAKAVHARLAIMKALVIDKDPAAAAEAKRAGMPEGWQKDWDKLNEFAWWCFENKVNLEEAEALARKGAELAAPGRDRAMVLDTLAQIVNRRGDTDGAIKIERDAQREDPQGKGYAETIEAFEKLKAAESKAAASNAAGSKAAEPPSTASNGAAR